MTIEITPTLFIQDHEVEETFIRASGPGGQHVNKTSSAVQIRFDARRSPSLPNDVAIRLMKLAGQKLTLEGVIVITAHSHRSQARNREDALLRLVEMIREASVRPERRRPTKPTRASKERRLEGKSRTSTIKAKRQKVRTDE
ncbi:MAG: aminoacyl-tRNA hydrolase [Ancylobacter novellus]|uniref:Aminoacyl-tRNA hydrolase n=1 Tax=Ancylobacter novellus TaxID=921 RepID=A0A2W5KJW3_ANCNO|nr:MAG: aminoacyl-tRNA hydrolase [Ancylobacter novellus]